MAQILKKYVFVPASLHRKPDSKAEKSALSPPLKILRYWVRFKSSLAIVSTLRWFDIAHMGESHTICTCPVRNTNGWYLLIGEVYTKTSILRLLPHMRPQFFMRCYMWNMHDQSKIAKRWLRTGQILLLFSELDDLYASQLID